MRRLSSEARRWLIVMAGLLAVAVGIGLYAGLGAGLIAIGAPIVIIAMLYDPERVRRTP